MEVLAIDNVLRISVRIDLTVGTMPFAMADLSLPAWSSLAEILDEILDLTGAPTISRPWVARTAAGIPIDPGVPLSQTQLEQGGVLVISPERDLPSPVVRDAAEALVELSSTTRTSGLVDLLTLTGFITTAVLLTSPALNTVGVNIRLLIMAAVCVIILAWLPRVNQTQAGHPQAGVPITRAALPVVITGLISVSAMLTVTNPLTGTSDELAWGLLCASATGFTTVIILQLLFRPPLLISATLTVLLLMLSVPAAGAAISGVEGGFSGPAAITIAVIMILISTAPKLAASLAGLRVPALPTAGQDLSVSDGDQLDPAAAAARAQTLYDAQILAFSLTATTLIVFTTQPGTWFSTLFAFATALAALLHSIRQSQAVSTWSLMALACAGIISAVISATRQEESWAALILGIILAGVTVTIALWISRIPTPEPTTIVWLERIESLSVAAVLPLALHLLDIFGMLRSLNIGLGG